MPPGRGEALPGSGGAPAGLLAACQEIGENLDKASGGALRAVLALSSAPAPARKTAAGGPLRGCKYAAQTAPLAAHILR